MRRARRKVWMMEIIGLHLQGLEGAHETDKRLNVIIDAAQENGLR